MKNTHIIGSIVAVLVIIGIGLSVLSGSKTEATPAQTATLPVIQILKPSVFVLDTSHKITRELKDGDSLVAPIHIRSSDTADATIVYPDGSSARLSPGTELTLEQGSYDTKTGSIQSNIFLILGHVWSKVVALATPESQWQVETAQAVATVRGTAFDTKVKDGQTTFIGSEHTVEITPVDPHTKKGMSDKKTMLAEKMRMVVEDTKVDTESASSTDSEDRTWVEKNRGRDAVLDGMRKDHPTDTRDQMFKNKTDFEHAEGLKVDWDTPPVNTVSVPKTEVKETEKPLKIVDVQIRTNIPDPLTERTAVTYSVIAKTDSGQEKDVTREAKVRVEGGIGKITSPGTFMAELAPDKTELGEAFGAILGTWTDPTGKVFDFGTRPFSVKLFIEKQLDTRG